MSMLTSKSKLDENMRRRALRMLRLGAACSLCLFVSPAFAQNGQDRSAADFDELIRREELKGGPTAAPSAVPPSAPATDDLARKVQAELRRVGCDAGAPDGIWGPLSQRATASFNRYGKAQYSTAAPSEDLLQDLRGRGERVCPAETPPPHIAAPPMEQMPEPSPPAAEEVSLAGAWSGRSDCPLDLGFTITLTQSGQQQYIISSSSGISGWVSGSRVHMEAQVLINHLVWDGTIDSTTDMSGKLAPSLLLGASCDWQAHKR